MLASFFVFEFSKISIEMVTGHHDQSPFFHTKQILFMNEKYQLFKVLD